jgi:hypothetical protein
MLDGLATFLPSIHDNAKAFAEALFRQLGCDQRQVTEHFLVVLSGLGERVDVNFGDDEKVRGRLRINVSERDRNVIFENLFGGNFSRNNPTK